MKRLLLLTCLLLPTTLVAKSDDAQKPVVFRTVVKVQVDETGTPTSIEAAKELPTAIRDFIQGRVSKWRFASPQRGGETGIGVTYLDLGACAVPMAGGYGFSIDYKGNGPGVVGAVLRPPRYPRIAMISGLETTVDVTYIVEPDGRVTWEKMSSSDRLTPDFQKTLKEWVRTLRYTPEEFNGRPVRTRVTIPVDFKLVTSNEEIREEFDADVAASRECKAADGLMPVAEDSPFKLISQGG